MNHRIARVKELLRRELSEVLQRDFVFEDALVTVNEVDVTPDFKQAHAYLGIIARDPRSKDEIIERLNKKGGAIQNKIMKRVVLKYTPNMHFKLDESVERGVDIVNLIDSIDIPDEKEPGAEDGERSN